MANISLIKCLQYSKLKNNIKNTYLLYGQNSQNIPKIAQHYKEIYAIQRGHHLLNQQAILHLQTLPFDTSKQLASKQLALALLLNLISIPSSSQGTAPVKLPPNTLTKVPLPVLAFN